jgi:hypothetical protein
MDSNSKQSPALELWLRDIQAYIYKLTGGFMKNSGFEFNRSNYSYKRKNKNSQDELSIVFISHFPVSYRVDFQLEIWHSPIREIKEAFMSEILNKESNLCSIILFKKDFRGLEPDSDEIRDHAVYNHRDLFMVGDWLAQTLQYQLVPLCDQMSSISHMDNFFTANPDWSLNTRSGGNICTDLIVGKLNKKRNIHPLYQQLMEGLRKKIELRQLDPECRQLLTLCYESLQ